MGCASVDFRDGGIRPWHLFGDKYRIYAIEHREILMDSEKHYGVIQGYGYQKRLIHTGDCIVDWNLIDIVIGIMQTYQKLEITGYRGPGIGNRIILPILKHYGLVPDMAHVYALRKRSG